MARNAYRNAKGRLTDYALSIGFVETAVKGEDMIVLSKGINTRWGYRIRGLIGGKPVFVSVPSLAAARKIFDQQKKTL